MIVQPEGATLLERFGNSIEKLYADIKAQGKWIDESDPDPEVTKNYMVNKKLKEWFMHSGGMGY